MNLMAADEAFLVPCCKPLRLIELFSATICFTLLFFTRNYNPEGVLLLPAGVLIYLFTIFGVLVALTGVDVLCQLIKEPITNVPMIVVTLLGTTFCLISGVLLTITYQYHSNYGLIRIMNVIALLAGCSYFTSIMFLIDVIILIRFA